MIEHTFRQSQLNEADMCLERARRSTTPLEEHEDWSGDAALYGTFVHAEIEKACNGWLEDEPWPDIEQMFEGWRANFWPATEDPRFKWLSLVKKQVETDAFRALSQWRNDVAPLLYPMATEVEFKLPIYQDSERLINISGTIDYVDRHFGLLDWKTAGRRYDRWEKQRWAIQPTAYTWAATELGLMHPDDEIDFRFVIFIRQSKKKGEPVQWVHVTRTAADWDWMKHKAVNLARMVEAVGWDNPWPLGDNGWWCSPKWCDYWAECKGAHYTKIEWKQ